MSQESSYEGKRWGNMKITWSEKKKPYKTFFGISFNFSKEDYGKRWQAWCANG